MNEHLKCPIENCKFETSRSVYLNRHLLKHQETKPYICSVLGCHYTGRNKDALLSHLTTHRIRQLAIDLKSIHSGPEQEPFYPPSYSMNEPPMNVLTSEPVPSQTYLNSIYSFYSIPPPESIQYPLQQPLPLLTSYPPLNSSSSSSSSIPSSVSLVNPPYYSMVPSTTEKKEDVLGKNNGCIVDACSCDSCQSLLQFFSLSLTISLEKLFFLGVSIINEFVLFETKQQEQLKDRV